jgi:hypothetical protein
VKQKDPRSERFLSTPCPICDVATGKHCVSHSGFLRIEPHAERKIAVVVKAQRAS